MKINFITYLTPNKVVFSIIQEGKYNKQFNSVLFKLITKIIIHKDLNENEKIK